MDNQTFDFTVLGDSHPEGLYMASGLARRGYSVCIVPSVHLQELPSQFPWPLRLPERIGTHRFDELLFRVGFFRLEESGLNPASYQSQFVMRKNRLSFDGGAQTFERELEREFPRQAERLLKIRDGMRRSSVRSLPKSLSQLQSVLREDPSIRDWVSMDAGKGRASFHLESKKQKAALERWLWGFAWPESKVYRVQNKMGQNFTHFLTEHAKKWGAQVLEEPIDIQKRFRLYEIHPKIRSKNLVVNTLGAFRLLAKTLPQHFGHQITHWLYFDRISCEVDDVPEPLEEFCYFHFSETDEFPFLLHTSKTKLRDRAQLTLGTWLPFQDSASWHSRIEQGRMALRRFLPFLSDNQIPGMPSILELNELKGECVKRGEMDRLIIDEQLKSSLPLLGEWSRRRPRKLPRLSKRIFLSMPYIRFHSDRQASLASCYNMLEHFEKKRARIGASKLW